VNHFFKISLQLFVVVLLYKTIPDSTIMGILTWADDLTAVSSIRYGNQPEIY
jgi:hypothetical protein